MFLDSNVNKIFFTADTHFGHANIIKYCNRPFVNVMEMDIALIEKWNEKVGKDDIVVHLGDFAFVKDDKTLIELVNNLNGTIYLIPGNHDDGRRYSENNFPNRPKRKLYLRNTLDEFTIKVEDEDLRFVFCHFPMRVWNKSHYGAIHLFGHCHGTIEDDPNARSLDVGVDVHNYAPVSLDDVLCIMYKKTFVPKDHHGRSR